MDEYLKVKWSNCDIKHLVLDADIFIVFIDNDIDVDWETKEEWEIDQSIDWKKHNEILNIEAEIESIPNEQLDEIIRLKFKRLLGEAVARSLQKDYDNAMIMLDRARLYINSRLLERSRAWYLKASSVSTLTISIFGFFMWILRDYVEPVIGNSLFIAIIVMIFGAIGAFHSIIMRMGKSALDCSAGKNLHYVEGVTRIIAGCISALIVFMVIKSGLLLSSVVDTANPNWLILAFSIAAGYSERFATSVISKITSSIDNESSETEQK